jgi:hypothetical protein
MGLNLMDDFIDITRLRFTMFFLSFVLISLFFSRDPRKPIKNDDTTNGLGLQPPPEEAKMGAVLKRDLTSGRKRYEEETCHLTACRTIRRLPATSPRH